MASNLAVLFSLGAILTAVQITGTSNQAGHPMSSAVIEEPSTHTDHNPAEYTTTETPRKRPARRVNASDGGAISVPLLHLGGQENVPLSHKQH